MGISGSGLKDKDVVLDLETITTPVGTPIPISSSFFSRGNNQSQIQEFINQQLDSVELNVGGKYFKTTRSTLTKIPNSTLAKLFQRNNDPQDSKKSDNDIVIYNDKDGVYYIDRNSVCFGHILQLLRDLPLSTSTPISSVQFSVIALNLFPESASDRDLFTREAIFYGLTAGQGSYSILPDLSWNFKPQLNCSASLATLSRTITSTAHQHSVFLGDTVFKDKNCIYTWTVTIKTISSPSQNNYVILGLIPEQYNGLHDTNQYYGAGSTPKKYKMSGTIKHWKSGEIIVLKYDCESGDFVINSVLNGSTKLKTNIAKDNLLPIVYLYGSVSVSYDVQTEKKKTV